MVPCVDPTPPHVPSFLTRKYHVSVPQDHQREIRLREFDVEVDTRLQHMQAEVKKLVNQLRKTLMVELIKLPNKVKKMSMATFRDEYGGEVAAFTGQRINDAKQKVEDAVAMPLPPPPAAVRQSTRKRKPLGNRTNSTATGAGGAAKKPKSAAPVQSRRITRSRSSMALSAADSDTPPAETAPKQRRTTRSSVVGCHRTTRASFASAGGSQDEDDLEAPTPRVTRQPRSAAPKQTPRIDARSVPESLDFRTTCATPCLPARFNHCNPSLPGVVSGSQRPRCSGWPSGASRSCL